MRLSTVFALLLALLIASPALAALGNEFDSEQQTQGYGRLLGFVGGGLAAIVLLLVGAHVIKGMIAESTRGKKTSEFREEILDKTPEKARTLYLGEKVPDWKVVQRQDATKAALKFLSSKRDWFDRKYIVGVVDKAFQRIKAALEERSTKGIEKLVTAECLEELQTEAKRLRKKGELHIFGRLEITDIQVVHIEAPTKQEKHAFTALISASSRDYFKDDKKTYVYQEFWRFRRAGERWLVERIRPAGDMDRVLDPKNVLAQTDLDKFAKTADPEHLKEFVAG
jgi:predicted lipid-binding transport protein (Tim44 family)